MDFDWHDSRKGNPYTRFDDGSATVFEAMNGNRGGYSWVVTFDGETHWGSGCSNETDAKREVEEKIEELIEE